MRRLDRTPFRMQKAGSNSPQNTHSHTHTHTHTHARWLNYLIALPTHPRWFKGLSRICPRTLPLVKKEAVRTQMGGSVVKNQPNCLQKEAFTSEIEAVWVVFASLVSQNRGFRFQRSGPTNKIKIAPCSNQFFSTLTLTLTVSHPQTLTLTLAEVGRRRPNWKAS